MFQHEFALRLVARPNSKFWCRLSANAQLYAKIDLILKVGRNNFRPPPQVDSSVVRIVPLNPPPSVRFEEFDGLARIVFNRRNKVLHANFQARGVLDMLQTNRLSDTDLDLDQQVRNMNITDLVNKILKDTGYAEERAAKMDINDFRPVFSFFLRKSSYDKILVTLLTEFNKNGLHFS